MALKPADDPGQRSRRRQRPASDAESRSVLERGFDRLKQAFRSIHGRFRRALESTTAVATDSDRTDRVASEPRMLEAPAPFRRDSDPPELTDCPSVAGLTPRDRPLTVPDREEPWENEPDPVVRETDAGRTLALPGEPDATITSDVWEPIEP